MMSNPFNFVLGILFIVIGIPVLSNTIITLIHGPKETRKDRKHKKYNNFDVNSEDSKMLEEIYYGLRDLGKRVKNLETILDNQGDEDE